MPTSAQVLDAVAILREAGPALTPSQSRALSILYTSYLDVMKRAAQRITRCAADAEDVAHDVFVSLPRWLAHFRGGNLEAWLVRVTQRRARMAMRRLWREVGLDVVAAEPAYAGTGPDLEVEVEQSLQALPPAQREVLVLRLYQGKTHAEIAAALRITERASQLRAHRAMKALRGQAVFSGNAA